MEFSDLFVYVIAAAEGKKGMPLVPHVYAIPILFLIAVGVGYWYKGRKS